MKTVPLGEVASIETRGTDPSQLDPTVPYLGLEHMQSGGDILRYSSVGEAAVASTKFRFTPDHVLFGKLRPNLGKIAIADREGVCSTDILPIAPGPELDKTYLKYCLRQPHMIAYAASRAAGANLPRLNPGQLKHIEIPLPEVEEQRRIAAILDKADALRAKRRQTLAHLDSLTQSLYEDMFGDPDETPTIELLSDVASLEGGRNLVGADQDAPAKYRVLKISAVTTGRFLPEESKALPADYEPPEHHLVRFGDLLMSRANTEALVGAVAYVDQVPSGLVLPDKVWRFVWKDNASEPLFYAALLRHPSMRRRISRLATGTGGSMKNISKAKLGQMTLPKIPPGAQSAFVERLAHVPAMDTMLLDRLFSSLQARAFRGEL